MSAKIIQTMEDYSEAEYSGDDNYEDYEDDYTEENDYEEANYDQTDEEYKWNKQYAETQVYHPTGLDLAEETMTALENMPIVVPEFRRHSDFKPHITTKNDFSTMQRVQAAPQIFTTYTRTEPKKALGKRKPDRVGPNKQKAADSVVIDKAYLKLQAERRATKRAKRKEEKEKTVTTVVPRPTLYQQEWEIECEENLDIECETPKFEVIEKITYCPVKEAVEEMKEAEMDEEEDDDDFAEMMAAVQNKPVKVEPPKPQPPKVQPKPVAQFIQPTRTQPQHLEKTRMCFSYGTRNKCPHGERCRFAHNTNELAKRKCRFDTACRHIHSERPCEFWHGQETVREYCQRLGIKC